MTSPPLHKRIKRFARFLLIRAAVSLLALLPLATARRFGAALGRAGFRLARGERQKALEGVARAFPELTSDEREALVRRSFAHLGTMALELVNIRKIDPAIEALVRWGPEDRAMLDAALARGKGVVFVTGHVGNWELLARRIAKAGYPSQSIAKETSDPGTTRLVERFRAEGGVRSIWRGQEGAARHMLRALKNNEILGLLIDQDTKVQSVFVPFFGALASTPRAAADLALRTGAAVVCGFCQREADGTYRLTLEEVETRGGLEAAHGASPVPRASLREAAVLSLTAALTARIERAIRRAPEQWVWMHRRWKTRPQEGDAQLPTGEATRGTVAPRMRSPAFTLFLAASLASALGSSGCTPPARPTGAAPPQVTLIGARLQVFRGEELVAHGRSAKVTYQRNSGDVVAREAFVKLPRAKTADGLPAGGASGDPGIELRAPEVSGNLGTQFSAASGGVKLRSGDGVVGTTERAEFDGQAQRARGSDPVHLEGAAGWTLDAAAFEFLLPEERFAFMGPVTTRSSKDAPQEVKGSGP